MNPKAHHKLFSSPTSPALCAALLLSIGSLGCGHGYRSSTTFAVNETFVQISNDQELEPNDESASPHFLGVLRHGEMMTVSGHAEEGDPAVGPFADEFDGFSISLAEPSEIEFELTFDDSAGELDTWIYDPAIDDIAIFFESDFSPETGFFNVSAPVLDFHIVVRALFGQANYTLDIKARPITSFASTSGAALSASANEPGVQISPGDQMRAPAEVRPDSPERELARERYVGRKLSDATPDLTDAPIQSGLLIMIRPNGPIVTAPIFAVAPAVYGVQLE